MTQQLKQQYSELIALTQVFLLQQHGLKEQIISTPQTHACFSRLISNTSKPQAPAAPAQAAVIRPAPSEAMPMKPSLPKPQPMPLPSKSAEPPPEPQIPAVSSKSPPAAKTPAQGFNLEPLSEVSPTNLQDMKEIFVTHFPQYPICEQIPSDHLAQKIKKTWQTEATIPPIVLLSFNDQDKPLAFLKNVAQAITRHLAPARVLSGHKIEKEKKWDSLLSAPELKLIIASDYGLYLQPGFMQYYKGSSPQAKHFLKDTPLLLLSDLSLYLKEPQLKPLLWRTICNEFEALKHSLR